MKASIILSLASLALGSVIEQRACPGNNCNRQVTGTRAGLPDLASRSADCSSFIRLTVTPTPRTRTVTTFIPEPTGCSGDEIVARAIDVRQVTVTASAIPTYASSCDDGSEYSSACSCLGVTTANATTVRAPRVTSTVTSVATACASRAIAAVPTCAYDCFLELYPSYGCGGLDDLPCQCANFETLGTEVTPCVVAACSHADVELIFPAAQMGCDCYSVANPSPTAV
ncbi:hypothetical protein UCRPA7_7769 [Phaeoacremonium minimum UCRPA7]|uniref:CFEM domain-containing protein n=1 Tax=Phaeoacremonium minimum (strain UCR-PA7) TaxID=1286976 RepID=R8BBS8_PHAM7|nr:hypothetical protein UCRPA7_7769 [Phaeoacremonium minimum UCRPA7]EON96737.1 hypothetical protein UCRPA7_7769 [Phaeoacremonium minimum UCRPA7]